MRQTPTILKMNFTRCSFRKPVIVVLYFSRINFLKSLNEVSKPPLLEKQHLHFRDEIILYRAQVNSIVPYANIL